jgi:hypothetical protein
MSPGADTTLTIPSRGKYSHGLKIEEKYDKFANKVAVRSELWSKRRGGALCAVDFHSGGCAKHTLSVEFEAPGGPLPKLDLVKFSESR